MVIFGGSYRQTHKTSNLENKKLEHPHRPQESLNIPLTRIIKGTDHAILIKFEATSFHVAVKQSLFHFFSHTFLDIYHSKPILKMLPINADTSKYSLFARAAICG